MNELMPLNFGHCRTDEAGYDATVIDKLKRYWLTSYGMGQMFGAKSPKDYVSILRHRFPNLPKGRAFTVKALDGKQRESFVYDLLEVFEYARHSDLPGAKQYVARFPYIMLDSQSGKIKPRPPKPQRKLIAIEGLKELDGVCWGDRLDTRKRVAEAAGMSYQHTYWHAKQMPGFKYGKGRKAVIIRKRLPLWLKIEELLQTGLQGKEVAQKLHISEATVSAYINIYSKKIGELLANES